LSGDDDSTKIPEFSIPATIEVKAVTYLLATPEEVANALVDEKTRAQWDPHTKSVQKKGDD
jgi:hypothetical protein